MAAPARLNSDKTAAQTMHDMRELVTAWTRDAGSDVIGAWDVPHPAQIGGRDATIRIQLRGKDVVVRAYELPTYALNLRACYLALESMRLNERRGIGDVVREAYAQIAAPVAKRDPYDMLGVLRSMELEDIEAVWKRALHRVHPDVYKGDDATQRTAELNEAIAIIRREKAGAA